ncbi:hypothetical protein THIOM_001571 [Candidatus Thiomargarita nelsonii]|uniref:Uncharacterized protein n=1 Tax=Candidatus Thiomargarita nelsonii TaxID=1003181 RepID=A0A176S3N8_9GAMM|nr:hypothetical protein THIOM_001571 [Candidatus Thiomargarita nelsonii]
MAITPIVSSGALSGETIPLLAYKLANSGISRIRDSTSRTSLSRSCTDKSPRALT